MPRDRECDFEPQLVKKNQTSLNGDIEEKILSMYAKDMTTSDIEAHIKELYERGITTYPRSDCQYLPTSARADAQKIFSGAAAMIPELSKMTEGADTSLMSTAFDDSEVQEHYAIIPTGKRGELTHQQKKVFQLIASRYIVQFYPDYEYQSTRATISFAGETFTVSGTETVRQGWHSAMDGSSEADETEAVAKLPTLSDGEELTAVSVSMKSRKTSPPTAFTDATLLKAMNAIHNFVEDPKIKKVLRDNDGLGTAATQAAHIDNIIKRGYVVRDGKKIVSTERGQKLIDALPKELTTPDRTALWEMEMDEIANGRIKLDLFVGGVFRELEHLSESVKSHEGFVFAGGGYGKKAPKQKKQTRR